jgi:hypothetical protein
MSTEVAMTGTEVPIYQRENGRLSFLPAGHLDRPYVVALSTKRIDIDYVNDLATIGGAPDPFTPGAVAVGGKSGMFGLAMLAGLKYIHRAGAAPDAPPPPPPPPKKTRRKKT